MTERYLEVEDSPVSAVGREARIWQGSSSRPFPWSEVFFNGTPISRDEFYYLRRLSVELAT